MRDPSRYLWPWNDHSKSTLRLPGLKARACSGLTLSGASLPRLQRRGLGAAEWVMANEYVETGSIVNAAKAYALTMVRFCK